MTTFADGEVFTAECALAVVTGHAALPTASRMMIQRFGRTHLSSLRHAWFDLMTLVASDLQMFRVTETDTERRHEFRRARIAAQLMTGAARGNIAAAGLRSRRMTSITSCVRIEPGRDRHGDARARRSMTGRATDAAHRDVSRVIELHAKTLQMRKRFERARLHIGVADRADRTFRVRELLRVTTGARQVTRRARTFRNRRARIAPVTQETGQTRMIATAVLELSIVQTFRELHLFLRSLGIVFARDRSARREGGNEGNAK